MAEVINFGEMMKKKKNLEIKRKLLRNQIKDWVDVCTWRNYRWIIRIPARIRAELQKHEIEEPSVSNSISKIVLEYIINNQAARKMIFRTENLDFLCDCKVIEENLIEVVVKDISREPVKVFELVE